MYKRTSTLLGLGLAAMGTLHAADKPNVILIITDDQGYGDLACHGNPYIKTPNLDKLHSQSTRLDNYHVGPTCAPTRAGLMTGRYCNATGVWHTIMGRSLIRKDEKTMADMFKAGGYTTGFYGKWHLGDNYPFLPSHRGFDDVWRHGGGGVGQTPDYFGNDYFDDTYWVNGKPTKFEGYCTDIWFKGAKQFIEKSAKADKPFFAYITTNAPHSPYFVAEKYSNMYKDDPNVPKASFYGMITNIDDNVGALMKQLDDLGIADDTILMFTTDNGTSAGVGRAKKVKGKGAPKETGFSAGMRGRKGSEYDGGHRVPMFMRWKNGKLTAGKDVTRLTAHIDMIPTLAELCGIDLPKGGQPLDGKSVVPLLRGDGTGWPDRTIVTDSQRKEKLEKWRKCATMTEQWR
jgi:arylsulfatase A-like enzyme